MINMSEAIRSFIAFDIEDQRIIDKIQGFQRILAETGADLKLVEPQNIHITLRFLGNITLNMIDKVYDVMKNVSFKPFTIKIQGVGAFPKIHHPSVIWAGIKQGTLELRSIFDQLEFGLRQLGFPPEPKGFSPHITIARVKSGRSRSELVKKINENANIEFGSFIAECLRLKRSELTPKGPIYSTLREFKPGLKA